MMRAIWSAGGVLLVGLALFGCEARTPAEKGGETTSMSDEDMLNAQLDKFEDAWAAGDAKAIAAMFVSDGSSVDPSGEMFQGRDAIEKRYQDLLGGQYNGTEISLTMTSSRFPQPDVAIAEGSYEISGMKTSSGADIPTMKGRYLNVVVKQGGEWMINASRPMIPIPPPPGAAATEK